MLFKKRTLRSSKKTRERRRTLALRALVAVVIIIVAIGGFSWASHWSEITIQDIRILGSLAFTDEDIREYIEGEITGRYWGMLSRANVFLYPKWGIESGLLNAFPKLSNVDVSFHDFQSITTYIEERKPHYLWCGEELPEENDAVLRQCYFLDLNGIIFTQAPYFSGNVYFEFYGSVLGQSVREENIHEPPLGFSFLPEEEFRRVIAFRNSLASFNIQAQKFIARDEGDYEFVIENGAKILFNKEQDFDVLLNNLDAALETEELNEEDLTGEDSSLEYLDLRFNNRVFYKFSP